MKKAFGIFAVILLILSAIGTYIVFFATYSEGYRVGTVIKMTKRGIFFKTHEGQLHTGGLSSDTGEGATSMWDFTVRRGDVEIREQIESAVDNGYKVKLFYDEQFYQWAMFGETKYFVSRVEPIKNEKKGENSISKE
ncbi:MAG: hypothetical protein ACPGD5_03160 [Salibacteraceae bacterium]